MELTPSTDGETIRSKRQQPASSVLIGSLVNSVETSIYVLQPEGLARCWISFLLFDDTREC